MNREDITFERLPQAIIFLLDRIDTLERKIDTLTPQRIPHTTIDIQAASKIIGKSIPTIYRLVRTGEIPVYKRGQKLYFVEDELREWITTSPITKNKSKSSAAKDYIEGLAQKRKRNRKEILI